MDKKIFLKRLYPLVLILVVFIVWKIRQQETPPLAEVSFSGTTMGTIGYNIKYFSETGENYEHEIDSLLKVWNMSMSTYIPGSEISRFNKSDSCFEFESKYFLPVLNMSRTVYELSDGAFDPTVGPLVEAWGFGPQKRMTPDSATVDSLRRLVGFDKIFFDDKKVCKAVPGMHLDFSAIAKGYAVDVVADYLESKGVHNLLVEIGGELLCRGTKNGGQLWRTAIEDPNVEVYERKILAVVNLTDKAVATSGNYRNYYVRDGRKYVHTINPATGYPIIHSLLSASVFADNCMKADACATACMVLGLDGAKAMMKKDTTLDAFLIYSNDKGETQIFVTDGIAKNIEMLDAEE